MLELQQIDKTMYKYPLIRLVGLCPFDGFGVIHGPIGDADLQ